jgi:hypothetical protein
MVRMQISLSPEDHRRLRARAGELGVSAAEYVRKLIRAELAGATRPKRDLSGLVGLGRSGLTDVSERKDDYVAQAIADEHARRRRG